MRGKPQLPASYFLRRGFASTTAVTTPSPMISAQQTLKLPAIAIDYRADATKPLPRAHPHRRGRRSAEADHSARSDRDGAQQQQRHRSCARQRATRGIRSADSARRVRSEVHRAKLLRTHQNTGREFPQRRRARPLKPRTSPTPRGSKACRRNSAATIASIFLRFARRPTASSRRSIRVIRPR